MEEPSEIASIFGGDEAQASRIPEDLRPILLERWSKLRRELDSSRPNVSGASSIETSVATAADPSNFEINYLLQLIYTWRLFNLTVIFISLK